MGDIGLGEILLIVILALLLYGKDLPQAARKAGAAYARFKTKMRDLQSEVMKEVPEGDLQREIDQADEAAGKEPKKPAELPPPRTDDSNSASHTDEGDPSFPERSS